MTILMVRLTEPESGGRHLHQDHRRGGKGEDKQRRGSALINFSLSFKVNYLGAMLHCISVATWALIFIRHLNTIKGTHTHIHTLICTILAHVHSFNTF